MGYQHAPDHDHTYDQTGNRKKLLLGFVLICVYMVAELIGAWFTNSLALLSDAIHMLSDAVALGLSFVAAHYTKRASNVRHTYGFKRFEVLVAFLNGLTLILISFYILYEAFRRIKQPEEVMGLGMLLLAVGGLLINLLVAWILTRGDKRERNLNVRSALAHVMGDLLCSVGAIVAALLMVYFGWYWADSLVSVLVCVLILVSGWRIFVQSWHILMEGNPVPEHESAIRESLESLPGVHSIHDFHLWSISSEDVLLTVHITLKEDTPDPDTLLREASRRLKERFGIRHSTLQLESLTFTQEEERKARTHT